MCVLSRNCSITNTDIGKLFNYKGHCMVYHANKFIEDLEYIHQKTDTTDYYYRLFLQFQESFVNFNLGYPAVPAVGLSAVSSATKRLKDAAAIPMPVDEPF